jgi:hypothetical protein
VTRLASGLRAAFGALVLVAVLAGCRVQTEVTIDVADDGSGVVAVGVGLDPDATSRVPGLDEVLRLDDLTAAGWEVEGPQVEDDGHTWVRASKPFADPDGLAVVLAEVTGPDGPFQGFALTEDRLLARTTYELTGTVDLSGGLEAFTDEELAALLGGEPLGASVEELEAQLGEPLADVFTMDVAVSMPDGTESSWQPAFTDAEPTAIEASATVWRPDTLALAGVAVLAALLLLLIAVVAPLRRLRRRRDVRPRGRHASRWG